MADLLLSEWRLLATALVVLLFAIFLLLLRFIQPRAVYGARHIFQITEVRRLFLRKLAGKTVDPAAFVNLLGSDFRHESVDSSPQVVLTRVSRLRELFRLLNPHRTDLPPNVVLPDVSVCVTELSQIIGSMARRLVAVPEYDYDLVPAHVVLGAIADRVEKERREGFRLDSETDIEEWFGQHPISIEQVSEVLIAVVFALSLRELANPPVAPGRKKGQIPLGPTFLPGPDGIQRMVKQGESRTVEFKSSLRRNLHTGSADADVEYEIVKTIAAFLNTHGGTLLVGVADDGTICGYDTDLFRSDDQVKRYVGSKVRSLLRGGADLLVETNIEAVGGKEIVRIECRRSPTPTFVRDSKGGPAAFFVRGDAATSQLDVSEVKSYIESHFKT